MASEATLERLHAEFDSPAEHITAAVELLEQKATPAFLARYRRHELGNLGEERLHAIAERLHALSTLEQRRATILQQADERGRRTPELEQTLARTADQDVLDDYYQSMRPRRRGTAMQMEEKGLLPLALAIQHRQFGDAAIETVPTPRDAAAPAAATAGESEADTSAADTSAADAPAADTPAADAPAADAPAADAPAADAPAAAGAESTAQEPTAPEGVPEPDAAPATAATTEAEAATAAPSSAETPTDATANAPVDAQPTAAATATAVPDVDLHRLAAPYVAADQGVADADAALEGALRILADRIVHDPVTRARFRDELRRGVLRARPVDPDGDGGRYKQFFAFAEPINRIPANRMLALRRAEREKILKLTLTLADGRHREVLRKLHATDAVPGTQLGDFYDLVFDQAALTLQDVCGKDVRRKLKEKADREAMRTYARNLRSHLLAPPLGARKVLSLRTSGKAIWAVLLDEDGSVGEHKTLPVDNDEQRKGALDLLCEWIRTHEPRAIALPHGRRQAGSEKIVQQLREALGETPMPMVVPVDEAASTIFATSTSGKKAIPGVEVGTRTAISLGRRLQDPLLELVRMEARTLGIGQTLDDVHQGTLQRELQAIKSACLSQVGCDVNTSDSDLLQMLPGLTPEQAQAIVKHRKQHGGFQNRAALRDVDGIDETTFRNIAGMLFVTGGDEPLDATPLHPDDYELVRAIAAQKGVEPSELFGKNLRDIDADALTSEATPKPRVIAVLQQLQRVGKDDRGELIATANEGVHTLADLHADRELQGRVATLTEFGAFVDLGIGQDGLVHISQIPGHRLRDPNQMLRVGEVVTVWVLNVDQQKQKIGLTMHKPRHLAEGRLPTLGERMQQQQGRRRGGRSARGPRDEDQSGRRPGSGGGRRGAPGGRDQEGRGGGGGFGGGGGGRGGPRRDRGDRGPHRGGPREQRVYTVEPAREVAEHRTEKGEVTSLSGLRNLLGGSKPKGDDDQQG